MKKLSDKVTEITGEKIDHYIDVDFSWFTKVIDALGGVEIQIPENFSDDKYPDNNWWYKTLVFRKWTWNMTKEHFNMLEVGIQQVILIEVWDNNK